ncbi:MAG TPA: hypothetical protein VGF18_06320 [Candidatus Tumulicola sp.]
MPRGRLSKNNFYVERRPSGDYSARRGESQRASFTAATQGEAARKAHAADPNAEVFVLRVRARGGEPAGIWRKIF